MSKIDYSGQVHPGTAIAAVDQDGHFRSLRSTHMTRSPPESDIAKSALFEGSSKTRITSNESKSALTSSSAVREVKFHRQKKFSAQKAVLWLNFVQIEFYLSFILAPFGSQKGGLGT